MISSSKKGTKKVLWKFRGRREDFSQKGKKKFHGNKGACDLSLQRGLGFIRRSKGKGTPVLRSIMSKSPV